MNEKLYVRSSRFKSYHEGEIRLIWQHCHSIDMILQNCWYKTLLDCTVVTVVFLFMKCNVSVQKIYFFADQ